MKLNRSNERPPHRRFGVLGTSILILFALVACTQDGGADSQVVMASTDAATIAGDSERGRRFFIQCQACHTVAENGGARTGPNLWGLLGRNAGKLEGFEYSDGLAEANFTWTVETLDAFLADPNGTIPGTNMIFSGIASEAMRQDLIAYLVDATAIDAPIVKTR